MDLMGLSGFIVVYMGLVRPHEDLMVISWGLMGL